MGQGQGNPFFMSCAHCNQPCGMPASGTPVALPRPEDIVKISENRFGEVTQIDPNRLLPVCVRTMDGRSRWYAQAKVERVALPPQQEMRIRAEITKGIQQAAPPEVSPYEEAAQAVGAIQAKNADLRAQATASFGNGVKALDTNTKASASASNGLKPVAAVVDVTQPQSLSSPFAEVVTLLPAADKSQSTAEGVSLLDGSKIKELWDSKRSNETEPATEAAERISTTTYGEVTTPVHLVEATQTATSQKEMTPAEYEALFRSELQEELVVESETVTVEAPAKDPVATNMLSQDAVSQAAQQSAEVLAAAVAAAASAAAAAAAATASLQPAPSTEQFASFPEEPQQPAAVAPSPPVTAGAPPPPAADAPFTGEIEFLDFVAASPAAEATSQPQPQPPRPPPPLWHGQPSP
mmetsp:Transcript_76272/g.139494  ORF Transcript_76272/g.139494 Transcript_76272/m.139494 type:complete len:409 (-) Transcript_76272:475-1701(-)